MPVSVHQRVVGRCGLGSSATQLMRAVRRAPTRVLGRQEAPGSWVAFWRRSQEPIAAAE